VSKEGKAFMDLTFLISCPEMSSTNKELGVEGGGKNLGEKKNRAISSQERAWGGGR